MVNTKEKILIIYHSGAGSTRTISTIYHKLLSVSYSCDLVEITPQLNIQLDNYDFIIIGFPTYHCSPSRSLLDFINNLSEHRSIPGYCFTTCGLCSGNAERIVIKHCRKKGINIKGSQSYKSPATDGVLFFPPIEYLFRFDKDISSKIVQDIKHINGLIKTPNTVQYHKRFKVYTIINAPNKFIGQLVKHTIQVDYTKCSDCYKCMEKCIRGCFSLKETLITHENYNCEYCFKCIHHCPSKALKLSKKTQLSRLNESFYKKMENQIMDEVNKKSHLTTAST